MDKIFFLLPGLVIGSAVLASENDFRCLRSLGPDSAARLQFSFPNANQDPGFITHANAGRDIPVKRRTEKTVEERHHGRPSVFKTEWEEAGANGPGGTYVIMSQGALIYEFKYLSRDGEIIEFEVDRDAMSEAGCRWNAK